MFETSPCEIIYSLPEGQKIHFPDDIASVIKVVEGLPQISHFTDGKHRLLIIDDQSNELDDSIVSLFTRDSHHKIVSVIVLTQNIFNSKPGFRTISLNAHYIVLFRNPRAKDQIACLGRQICPNNIKFFQEAFESACDEPYTYMLLDMTQMCPDKLRFRANIFPNPLGTSVFIPTKKWKNCGL